MRNFAVLYLWWVCLLPAYTQIPDPAPFGKTITREELRTYMEVIASAEMEGREVGTPGVKKAAAYIARQFQDIGLLPAVPVSGENSYYQDIHLTSALITSAYISGKGFQLTHTKEMLCMGGNTQGKELKTKIVYVGEGNPEDYEQLDVSGKAVLLIDPSEEALDKKQYAQEKGAVAFLVVNAKNAAQYNQQMKYLAYYMSRPRMRLSTPEGSFATFIISPESAAKLLNTTESQLKKLSPGISTEITYKIEAVEKPVSTENVIGMVEGTDKKSEVIVISAHYDHIGVRGQKIYYGADDNGSGTVALLEIAEAFAEAAKQGIRPRRSVLFISLTAEEKGMFGSEYYTQHPLFPLDQTIVDLNMDMVGHLDQNHTEDPRFVTIVGSDWLSSELHEIHENANRKYVQLSLDYSFNSPSHPEMFYYRSDQYNFAKYGIPVIFYTSADHEDYHKPTDTIDRIKFERIEAVAQLIFYTAWEIANRENRLIIDKTPPD
ncbi:MAG: M28 family peptidase [Bacteroidia bacterium]